MRETRYDVIIPVCGGFGQNGQPHPWVIKRLEKTLELFTGKEFVLLSGRSTPHRPPPLDKKKFPIDECVASAEYLMRKGVNPKNILLEKTSVDTIGNAYFTRLLFAEPMKLRKILVVSSFFHMPRARKVFNWIYGLRPLPFKYRLDFIGTANDGMDKNLVDLKLRQERKNLEKLLPDAKRIKTTQDMHHFMFFKHKAYSCGKQESRLEGKILETY